MVARAKRSRKKISEDKTHTSNGHADVIFSEIIISIIILCSRCSRGMLRDHGIQTVLVLSELKKKQPLTS